MLSLHSLCYGFFYAFLRVKEQGGGSGSFPPPLPKDEELRLFRKAREGDAEARASLIEHNLRLVVHLVKKYYAADAEQDDLLSIGTIGLIKAIDSFDPDKGARFATYAGKCLQNEILMYFRQRKKHGQDLSLGDQIDVDKDGTPLTYMDVICQEDTIAEDLHGKLCRKKALDFLGQLSGREQQILRLRCGLGGGEPMTQRDIAARLGISRSYVSRIEKGALEKIAAYLETPL